MNFCSEIAAAIGRHIRNDGANPTPIPGVTLYTRSQPLHRTPGIYKPSICIVAQGCKRMHYGEYSHSYGRDRYLINSLTMPAEAEITDVSPERPFLGLILNIDRSIVSRLMIEMAIREWANEPDESSGICISSPMTERLKDKVIGLLGLLDDPLDRKILAAGMLHALHYEVLRGPHGYLLRNCVLKDARANRIASIIHYIEENYQRPLDVESIARVAGMSQSSLHEYFKHATSMSPMQFVKNLRLHQARVLLLGGSSASAASYRVGYSSPSQFSREFKRFFGDLPSQVHSNHAVAS